jgi:hypothetical protein
MKIRRDVVFVSSVLFTIALVCLTPLCWRAALSGRDRRVLDGLDACCQYSLYTLGHVGEASMALIFIGLIVTWTGYVKAVRSAWFIMFIVVWVWAFPLFLLGFIPDIRWIPFSELISGALRGPASARAWLYAVMHFAPMVIALILPIRPFFFGRETARTCVGSTPNRREGEL